MTAKRPGLLIAALAGAVLALAGSVAVVAVGVSHGGPAAGRRGVAGSGAGPGTAGMGGNIVGMLSVHAVTFTDAYVIMLTARADEIDKLVGLSVGADDYLTKPFSPRELVARIRTMLRRPRTTPATATDGTVHRVGALALDPVAREVRVDDSVVELTRTEFDLLAALAARPRQAFTRRQLIDQVWGGDWVGDEHLVDIHVGHTRRKLGDDPADPRFIRTVRGVGYRMGPG